MVNAIARFSHSSRNNKITRVKCEFGEMEGWVWVFSTPRVAIHEMSVMISAQRTSPEGWFNSYDPKGRKVKPPKELEPDPE